MATRIQLRRGTAAEWTGANPVLAAAEIGVETDTGQIKTGDGVTAWNDLSYVGGTGTPGADGKSAYEVAIDNGFEGTEQQWLESLEGAPGVDGKSAYEIAVEEGFEGNVDAWLESLKGDPGSPGGDGDSAYEVAVANGFEDSEGEWLNSLKGEPGDNGNDGNDGDSAYEVALSNGFEGTEGEWLTSLKGEPGEPGEPGDNGSDGQSAYELALDEGFNGTLSEWLESLEGEDGSPGAAGPGVAAGGSENQVLVKNSSTDFDTKWVDIEAGGGGDLPGVVYSVLVLVDGANDVPLVDEFWETFPISDVMIYLDREDAPGIYLIDGTDTLKPVLIESSETGIFVNARAVMFGWSDLQTLTPGPPAIFAIPKGSLRPQNESALNHMIEVGANSISTTNELPNLGYDAGQELQNVLSVFDSRVVPSRPETGTYVLKCVDGAMTWVEEV